MGFFKKVLILDIVVCGISLLLWFFLLEHTAKSLCNVLVMLGAITVVVGAWFVFGEKTLLGNLDHQWARSVSSFGPDERRGQDIKDLKQSETQSFPFLIAGAIAIGAGVLIYELFG